MGGLYSRVKTWVSTEDVTYSDLNAEFDNVLTNFVPLMMDDYSTNVAQMQVQTSPGSVGSESLATTLAGELARIRYMLKTITGETYWYTSPDSDIATISNLFGANLSSNRLTSGRVAATSSQPLFLIASGTARTITLDGTPTNFAYTVNSTSYTISSDVTLTSLTAAPSSNNTCLIDDANAAGEEWTKYIGEDGTEFVVDTMGTEILALIGKLAGFKIVSGANTEYFIAEVISATKLAKARRGFFFDSADAAIPRIAFSNNDTITLMKLTWVFAKTDGTLTATYNQPTWSKDEPSSPSNGDYWFDLDNQTWKLYNVNSFTSAGATLVGICLQDATATVAARSFEFFKNYSSDNTVEVGYYSTTQVRSRWIGATASVWGESFKNEYGYYIWDITTDLDTGVTEAASTYYYAYLTDAGDEVISNIRPMDRVEDLGGYYHPHKSWRCLGWFYNDASSNIVDVESYFTRYKSTEIAPASAGTVSTTIEVVPRIIPVSAGSAVTQYLPPAAAWRGQVITFIKTSSGFNPVTIDGFGSEIIGTGTAVTTTLYSQGETLDLLSNGTSVYVVKRYIPATWVNHGSNVISATTGASKGTVTTDNFWYRRVGDSLEARVEYTQTVAGTCNGNLLWGIPSAIGSADSAKVTFFTTASVGSNPRVGGAQIGSGDALAQDVSAGAIGVIPYNASNMRLMIHAIDGKYDYARGGPYFGTDQASLNLNFFFKIPMVGWGG